MNPENVKIAYNLAMLAIASYTVISVSKIGPVDIELSNKIDNGNKELLSELNKLDTKLVANIRDLKGDMGKKIDDLSAIVSASGKRTDRELEFVRGLTTQANIDVELMIKTWCLMITVRRI